MINPEHQRWIRTTARGMTMSKPWLTEDACQEGLIAFWEAWQHQPGNGGYCLAAAKLRMLGFVSRGDHAFGAPSHQGRKQVDEFYLPEDSRLEDYETRFERIEAELAHTRLEIAKAVRELTPRQQRVVYAVAFDQVMTSSQRGEWSARLRPRLQQKLAHLKEI